jgi:DNA-binding NarL/FixJ family response regulator
MSIRILLADDHQVVRQGLRELLGTDADLEILGEAGTGRQAIELAQQLNPDVVILDVTMPDINGIEAMREIRRLAPETEVIALSMHGARQVVQDMLAAGASGYMLKTASVQELTRAIRTVMHGQTYLGEEIRALFPKERLHTFGTQLPEGCKGLTDRECEVLKLVAEGGSSKQIAESLFVTTKTIVWHRQSIMDKLNIRTVAELTKYAIRVGLTSP